MDNQVCIRELHREIGELERLIAKAKRDKQSEALWGVGMLKRLLRRRRTWLWSFEQAGSHGPH